MENSGCKACPAYAKCTAEYRGSACAAMRDSYGLGDPKTHYDEIRAMNIEELADVFDHVQGDAFLVGVGESKNSVYPGAGISWLDWLKSPVEAEG